MRPLEQTRRGAAASPRARRLRACAALAVALLASACGAAYGARARWLPFWRTRQLDPLVTLQSAGAEPRRPLRYDYTRPPRPFFTVTQAGLANVRGVLQADESYEPPVLARWQSDGTQRLFGVTRVDWRLVEARTLPDAKVGEPARRVFDRAMSGLIGLRAAVFVGPRGQLEIEAPAAANRETRRIVDELVAALSLQMVPPLPAEPVGVGARWSARRDRDVGPARLVARLDYALDNVVEEPSGELGFELGAKIAFDQQPPAARVGSTVAVDAIEGGGEGRFVRMPQEATPVESELVYQVAMTLTPAAAPGDGHGYQLVLRARELLRAAALGPIDWTEDAAPPEVADARSAR